MLKLFFSKALDILTRYPLQIILMLVCIYAFWQKTRYEAVKSDYEAYVTSVQLQADMQKAKNEILKKQAVAEVTNIVANHTKELEAVKHEYEKRNKTNNITIATLRSELRDKLEGNIFRVPESASNSIINTESERECYAAYSTLESACKITTLDFNAIRSWADTVCQTVGCEESK